MGALAARVEKSVNDHIARVNARAEAGAITRKCRIECAFYCFAGAARCGLDRMTPLATVPSCSQPRELRDEVSHAIIPARDNQGDAHAPLPRR
jgi:hypothetical protein